MQSRLFCAGLACALAAGGASAHIVLSPDATPSGGYYAGVLRVTHGCAGFPTVSLRVSIPSGVLSAKPQPKPGWTLSVERQPLAQPVPTEGGGLQRDQVSAITWRGRLPDDEFDTFGLSIKAPAGQGPLYFPTVQTCEKGETRWTDIPKAGQAWRDVPHPAPVLTLGAPSAMAGMDHH